MGKITFHAPEISLDAVQKIGQYKMESMAKEKAGTYGAEVQGWAQQALPGGGSGIEGGSVSGVYTDKIKWGIHEIDVRPDGNGFWGQRRW